MVSAVTSLSAGFPQFRYQQILYSWHIFYLYDLIDRLIANYKLMKRRVRVSNTSSLYNIGDFWSCFIDLGTLATGIMYLRPKQTLVYSPGSDVRKDLLCVDDGSDLISGGCPCTAGKTFGKMFDCCCPASTSIARSR